MVKEDRAERLAHERVLLAGDAGARMQGGSYPLSQILMNSSPAGLLSQCRVPSHKESRSRSLGLEPLGLQVNPWAATGGREGLDSTSGLPAPPPSLPGRSQFSEKQLVQGRRVGPLNLPVGPPDSGLFSTCLLGALGATAAAAASWPESVAEQL